jgi:hypothetical protein
MASFINWASRETCWCKYMAFDEYKWQFKTDLFFLNMNGLEQEISLLEF